MDEFSLCFSDPLHIDMVLFSEWLDGYSGKSLSCSFPCKLDSFVMGRRDTLYDGFLREIETLLNLRDEFLRI